MTEVLCPGCGQKVSLEGLKVGDRMDCSNCADLTLRVEEKGGNYSLIEVLKVSCPSCECVVEVPEGLGPGNTMTCCGKDYTLTYEFGSFALSRDDAIE